MALEVSALPGPIGARIDTGGDVTLGHLSDSDRRSLQETFANNSVTLIRGASLDPESHLALTRLLGEPEIHPVESIRIPAHPEIIEVVHTPDMQGDGSSPSTGSDELVGQLPWHADLIYTPNPARGALLRALEVPDEGGETAFIDMTLAYEDLDASTKRHLRGKRAAYRLQSDLYDARNKSVNLDKFPEVLQPVVHRVPGSEKVALNINQFAIRIDGLEEEQSRRLIQMLLEHAIQDSFTYVHQWQVGDVIIWNNLRTLHSARGHKRSCRRVMHRTTLKGVVLEPFAL